MLLLPADLTADNCKSHVQLQTLHAVTQSSQDTYKRLSEQSQMLNRPTTLQDHSSRLIGIHHLLHDRLKHAPELPISQASIEGNVEGMPLAMTKPYFLCVPCARKEEAAVSVKADSHHPVGSTHELVAVE